MTGILNLRKTLLAQPPEASFPRGVTIRHYRDEADIAGWLALRDQAFAKQRVSMESWTRPDFEREFLCKAWWQPARMWLAETQTAWFDPWRLEERPAGEIVGAVALGERTTPAGPLAIVHWLMVAPRVRRCGLARALMAELERGAWANGAREIALETLRSWEGAVGLYRGIGYCEHSSP